MNEHIISGNQAIFDQQVLQSELPVLVDYWAKWCAPCKAMASVLDEVAEEYRDRLRVVKLNVEQEPQIARQYSVRSQPTLMLFKHGLVEAQKVGVLSKSQLKAFIEINL
ncbi:MAG TPA: thioredoxin [Gammaproteobacteria bacterium]|nr:thioredoxin [Gammaproteobacteria bacterium]